MSAAGEASRRDGQLRGWEGCLSTCSGTFLTVAFLNPAPPASGEVPPYIFISVGATGFFMPPPVFFMQNWGEATSGMDAYTLFTSEVS